MPVPPATTSRNYVELCRRNRIADKIAGRGKRNVCATRLWQRRGTLDVLRLLALTRCSGTLEENKIEKGNVGADNLR